MRAYEFLVEYDRSITIRNTKIDRLLAVANIDHYFQHVQNKEDTNAFVNVIFDAIESRDPTPNKIYVPWLIRVYMVGGVSVDSLNGESVLAKYHVAKTRGLLDGDDISKKISKDIATYKTYWEFFNALMAVNIDGILSANTKAGKSAMIDRGNHKVIYEDSVVKIVQPLDVVAAKHFGKGTKWCTAADNDNKFNDYTVKHKAKLYIFSPKKPIRYDDVDGVLRSDKYQVCADRDDGKPGEFNEVANAENSHIPGTVLHWLFPAGYDVLCKMYPNNGQPGIEIPKNDDIIRLVAEEPELIRYLPKEVLQGEYGEKIMLTVNRWFVLPVVIRKGIKPSYNVCLKNVSMKNSNIKYVPKDLVDEYMMLAAIYGDGSSSGIEYILKAGLTPTVAVWKKALKTRIDTIDSIPRDVLEGEGGEELMTIAVGDYRYAKRNLEKILSKGMVPSYKVWETAVIRSYGCLQLLPRDMLHSDQGEKLMITTVRNNRDALRFIVNNLSDAVSYAVYQAAVSAISSAILDVPMSVLDGVDGEKLMMVTAGSDEYGIQFIQQKLGYKRDISYNVYKAAVTHNGESIRFVPHRILEGEGGEDLIIAAITNSYLAHITLLKMGIPLSVNAWIAVVSKYGEAINRVPREILEGDRGEEIMIAAVSDQNYGHHAYSFLKNNGYNITDRVKKAANRDDAYGAFLDIDWDDVE